MLELYRSRVPNKKTYSESEQANLSNDSIKFRIRSFWLNLVSNVGSDFVLLFLYHGRSPTPTFKILEKSYKQVYSYRNPWQKVMETSLILENERWCGNAFKDFEYNWLVVSNYQVDSLDFADFINCANVSNIWKL